MRGVGAAVNKRRPESVAVRRFVNRGEEVDPDDGEVTRTRKRRRNGSDADYGAIIAAVYEDGDEILYEARGTYETGAEGTLSRRLALVGVDKRESA